MVYFKPILWAVLLLLFLYYFPIFTDYFKAIFFIYFKPIILKQKIVKNQIVHADVRNK